MSMTDTFRMACERRIDGWYPASGGTETPFKARSGATLLYCFNPATGKHAYLDCGSDIILTYEEAEAHMQR
jgi:hypothetical protein